MTQSSKRNLDAVKSYFQEIDQGRFPQELFTADFEFYFPKFGVGRGAEDFWELATGMFASGNKVGHVRESFRFIEDGRHVVIEGATYGTNSEGVAWKGGETPGGRFCSTFDFNEQGLIERMYVYIDPDYAGADKARFYWKRANPIW